MKHSINTHIQLSHPVVLLTKLLKIFLITSYQQIYQKNQSKRGNKETNENVFISDNNLHRNSVVYILGDSMTKHVNGRNVSGNYRNCLR